MAWDYSQTNDPGAVGAGKTWFHPTTGDIKIRSTSNAAWSKIGNSDLPNLGNVPITGASMSGPLSGLTGVAAADAHDFPTSARKAGVELATMNDLSDMQSTLYSNMSEKIAEAIAGYAKSGSARETVAVSYGEIAVPLGHGDNYAVSISRPVYSDNSVSKDSEIKSLVAVMEQTILTSAPVDIRIYIQKVDEVNYKIRTLNNGAHDASIPCRLSYIAVAVRQ